mgnify:CR=1 FL=1
MISGSVYANSKINETIQANIRPEINVERNDDNNTIEINVTHIRDIKSVVYKWNDEDEVKVEAEDELILSSIVTDSKIPVKKALMRKSPENTKAINKGPIRVNDVINDNLDYCKLINPKEITKEFINKNRKGIEFIFKY